MKNINPTSFNVDEIFVNNNKYEITSIEQLQHLFLKLENQNYKAFNFRGSDETSLLVIMNRNNSMCVYFTDRDGGDSYHIHNPKGDPDKYETFIISNGQADQYEESMLIDNMTAYDVMLFYFEKGKMFDKVLWEID